MPARVPLSEARGWTSRESPSSSSMATSLASSLLSSIYNNQASSPMLSEEEEDMMPGLGKSGRKQHEMRTKEKLAIRWSKHPEVYIIFLFHAGQVIWKKNGVSKVHGGATSSVGAPWG
jgi:hypothetical protein